MNERPLPPDGPLPPEGPSRPEGSAPEHPALASQRAAADPALSVWVAANAGSGKTRVLVDRVLRLMLAGTRPEAILCLTFTKAAAAEMANRLYRELGDWATADDAALREHLGRLMGPVPAAGQDLAAARRLFARLLDVPGGLKILTIHSFCQSLLGRFPLEAGVAPHFQVMDERSAAELMAAAQERLLEASASGVDASLADALRQVVALVDETGFAELMRELAGARGKLRRLLREHGDDVGRVIAATADALGLAPGEGEAEVLANACADTAFDAAGLARAAVALDAGSAADCGRAETLRRFLADRPGRPDLLQGDYRKLFLTNEGEPRKTVITKAAQAADPAALDILLAEQERVGAVQERLRAAFVAGATAALWRLGARLLDAYQAEKNAAAVLDYDDLILTARDLLRARDNAPWVLYKLDGGLDHILVDEAQDTSPEQWEVVAALAEEFFAHAESPGHRRRTVFAVGDEKQSIYSFQGADPAEFSLMQDHFATRVTAAGADWRPVELALSFRSTATVLRAVDAVFAPGSAAAVGLTAADRAVRHLPHRTGQAGLVEVWPTVKSEDAPAAEPWDAPLDQLSAMSPMARLAGRIADTIAGWLAGGEMLPARGRAVRPGDIMILVRRRNAFVDEMVRALKLRGVPVAGTDRMVLAEQIAVMDLLALARFALLPDDDLTLAEVLKGPLFGFSDEDLFALAHGRPGRLWRALEARRAENPLFASAHGELAGLLARADFVPPFEFFAWVLGARGGRRRLYGRLGVEAGDPIDEFLSLAQAYERAHAPTLQGFLHWLEAGGAEVKRDLEQGRDEVRVMTVHGAKGLEANIAFLPDTCGVPDARLDSRLLWQADAEAPLLLWPVRRANDEALCAEARADSRRLREEEYRRLLYVAMTRARDRLYICGFETSKGRAAGCWYDLVAQALADKAEALPPPAGWEVGGEDAGEVEGDGGKAVILRLADPQTAPPLPEAEAAAAGAAEALPAWAKSPPPQEPTPPRPLAPSRPEAEEPPVESPLGGDRGARFRRGRLIHRLLQTLPDLPPAERPAAAARFLARPGHALAPEQQAAIAAETLALFDVAEIAPLFGPGSQAEVPLAGVLGDRVLAGQVDRLVVTAERVLIVDFKSNRPPPVDPALVPEIYLRQMAAYRAALRLIYPGHAVEAALIWTDGPRLMPLPAALLDPWIVG